MLISLISIFVIISAVLMLLHWLEYLFTLEWWKKYCKKNKIARQKMWRYMEMAHQRGYVDKQKNVYGKVCFIPRDGKEEQLEQFLQTMIGE